jgi:hypothetical protein
MAGPHRGKEGSFLTSVATGLRAGVGEETVDAVKRKVAVLVGEVESRRGEEKVTRGRRPGPAPPSRAAPAL